MIQGDVSRGDVLFGAAVLAVVLPVLYGVGIAAARIKNLRFARAWAPLVPVVDGAVSGDRVVAAASTLAGTYRGARVRATTSPNISKNTHRRGNVHRWDVALLDVAGGQDWAIHYPDHVPLIGSDEYQVRAADPALVARLERAGAVAPAARLGQATVRYSAGNATLGFHEDRGTSTPWVPTPARFRAELDVLIDLAAMNAAVNPAPAPA